MAQQTAVEWLKTEMEQYGDSEYLVIRWTDLDELINHAKQMEKEQIMKAVDRGFDKGCNLREDKLKNAEQYYNDTYGKE